MITDEMVEVAAKALVEAEYDRNPSHKTRVSYARHDARAALAAILPMIRAEVLEEAAMVADDMGREEQTNTRDVDALMQACAREEMGYEIAEAIRAMKGDKT
jgi:hypothetical protein